MSTQVIARRELSRGRQAFADGALVAVTFIWGSTFVLVKDIVAQVPPMLFLSARFAIGAVCLGLLITGARRWRGFSRRELGWGAIIGVAVGFGYTFQTIGLKYTTASNAAFITGLLVVFAPVMGIFLLRQVPTRWATLGVAMATVGLAMLSLHFEEGVKPNWGDALEFADAIAFALQVALVACVSRWGDPLRMTLAQIVVAGAINITGSLLFEQPTVSFGLEIWAGAAFLGIFATAIAISIQMSAQSYTTVVHASLIYTLEPVFAAMFGYWLQNDRLGPIALSGALLIIAGMLLAELGPYLGRRRVTRNVKRET